MCLLRRKKQISCKAAKTSNLRVFSSQLDTSLHCETDHGHKYTIVHRAVYLACCYIGRRQQIVWITALARLSFTRQPSAMCQTEGPVELYSIIH